MNMKIFDTFVVGLVIALVAVIVPLRGKLRVRSAEPSVGPHPALTEAKIGGVIRDVHFETLGSIADLFKRDRHEVVSTVIREMGKASNDIKDLGDGKVNDLESLIQKLRELNSKKFGSMDNAVAGLAQQTLAARVNSYFAVNTSFGKCVSGRSAEIEPNYGLSPVLVSEAGTMPCLFDLWDSFNKFPVFSWKSR